MCKSTALDKILGHYKAKRGLVWNLDDKFRLQVKPILPKNDFLRILRNFGGSYQIPKMRNVALYSAAVQTMMVTLFDK